MRPSRAIVSPAGCLLFLLCLVGCQRPQEPTEPIPPYEVVDDRVTKEGLWNAYEKDTAEADKKYKGRILEVRDVGGIQWEEKVRRDGQGRKYLTGMRFAPGNPNEERELLRCYLHCPENPIVEGEVVFADTCGIKGVCRGKRGGAIILENCTIFIYEDWPPAWR